MVASGITGGPAISDLFRCYLALRLSPPERGGFLIRLAHARFDGRVRALVQAETALLFWATTAMAKVMTKRRDGDGYDGSYNGGEFFFSREQCIIPLYLLVHLVHV